MTETTTKSINAEAALRALRNFLYRHADELPAEHEIALRNTITILEEQG